MKQHARTHFCAVQFISVSNSRRNSAMIEDVSKTMEILRDGGFEHRRFKAKLQFKNVYIYISL
jgi:hypothetical protein